MFLLEFSNATAIADQFSAFKASWEKTYDCCTKYANSSQDMVNIRVFLIILCTKCCFHLEMWSKYLKTWLIVVCAKRRLLALYLLHQCSARVKIKVHYYYLCLWIVKYLVDSVLKWRMGMMLTIVPLFFFSLSSNKHTST